MAQESLLLGADSDGKERKAAYRCTVTCRIVPVSGLTLAPWLSPGCRAVTGSEPSRLSRCIKACCFSSLDDVSNQKVAAKWQESVPNYTMSLAASATKTRTCAPR